MRNDMIHSNRNRPLVAHVIHRLAVGGMENGLVNLINWMPEDRFDHVIICLTEYTDYYKRIKRPDVDIYELNKKEGKDLPLYLRLYRLLRRIHPDVVHTRNMAALECQLSALMAGVKYRIHGEHGWDMPDLHGKNKRYMMLRRAYKSLVHRYVAVSDHIAGYLKNDIGVSEDKIRRIYNGVDCTLFHPLSDKNREQAGEIVFGTVGRIEPVKNHILLVKAFALLRKHLQGADCRPVLHIIGDGMQRRELAEYVDENGLSQDVWMPGMRSDIPQLLRNMDVFMLPSLAEGISNTILEAMATGLPVIATNVGGNPELVEGGRSGFLVSPDAPEEMANAMRRYVTSMSRIKRHGECARSIVMDKFSSDRMISSYISLYESVMGYERGQPYHSIQIDK